MADHLDPVAPSDVTPENIDYFDTRTTEVINTIQFTDMANFSTELANLPSYKTNLLSQKHLKGTNLPGTALPGTVFFHVQVSVDSELSEQ